MSPRTNLTAVRSSEADGKAAWKSKFTDEQLERKRQVDRMSQRRTRQKSKQAVAQLQEKMNLLSRGDHKGLLERTLTENEELKSKLNFLQTRLGQIDRISKECMEVGDVSDRAGSYWHQGSGPTNPGLDSASVADEVPTAVGKMFSRQPSIFLCAVEQMRDTHGSDMSGLASNHFIESIMAWKYSRGLTDGLDYLLQHFNLRGFTNNDEIISRITDDDFYPTLLAQLFQDCGVSPPSNQLQIHSSQPTIGRECSLQVLLRKTAYLAYQLMRPWRDCYHSHLELEALFWAQYRHLLLFVFPSIENHAKCLPWYRPSPSMILHDHPGYIDFLLWPRLHNQLKGSWKECNTEGLVGNLIRGFKVSSAEIDPENAQIYLENGELRLSKDFETVLADDSNFYMQPHLFTGSTKIVRDDSLAVPNPPATENSGCPTYIMGDTFNIDRAPASYGRGVPAWTSPFRTGRYSQGPIASPISGCVSQLDHGMTQSNETVYTECIDGNSLAWDDIQTETSNFFMDAVGEL